MSQITRTMPHTIEVTTTKSVARSDESTHIVPRSGFKRLGYSAEQRARIREIRAELKLKN